MVLDIEKNSNEFKDDATIVGEIDDNKQYIDQILKVLQNELEYPGIELFGYTMFLVIIIFIDFISASDALLSGFISIMFAFFFLLIGLQYRFGSKVYMMISAINGYIICGVGIYNRVKFLMGLNEKLYTIREVYLIKRSIGGDIFTLTTFLLIFSFELIIASLYGILRKNLKVCENAMNV